MPQRYLVRMKEASQCYCYFGIKKVISHPQVGTWFFRRFVAGRAVLFGNTQGERWAPAASRVRSGSAVGVLARLVSGLCHPSASHPDSTKHRIFVTHSRVCKLLEFCLLPSLICFSICFSVHNGCHFSMTECCICSSIARRISA